jgi:trigger factor
VKSKRLPTADDEFAKTASEFDTLDELREDVRTKLRVFKEAESKAAVRDLVLRQVVDSVEVDLPERLVDEETEHRIDSAKERAERAGTTLEALLESQGWDELRFRSDARSHAVRALKSELVLEAVARQEGVKATHEEVEAEIRALAETTGKDAREVMKILERSGQVGSLAGDIIRSKALDLLVEAADVSTGGAPVPMETAPTEGQEGEHD